jgi:hypothetical protein
MLANGVVIQAERRCEPCDVDRLVGLDDETEDLVTCGIA